ncbi:hypothetical protein [Pseudocolwellia agarivorans]|uniref:hypothetical protein n=1 Tax=Pseudocolwellia agarivorans TaxID=1911682 RepID=UPI00158CAA2D|nr:hypothetical protein [Pseudocolwellia agarivorans]
MNQPTIVNTKAELKQALKRKDEEILITNNDLVKNIKIVKGATKGALAAAVAGTAIAATNFWNPVGWSVAGITAISSGALTVALVALGVGTLIWVLINDYDLNFEAGGEYTDQDGRKYKYYGKASAKKHKK